MSTRHHSHSRCFHAFPVFFFFAALLLPCIMQTKEQKRERPGNEAITREFSAPVVERGCAQYTAHHHSLFFSIWWLLSDTMVHFANTAQSVHAKMAFNKQSRGLCVYSKACTCLYTTYSMLYFFIAEEWLRSKVKYNLTRFIALANWKFLLPHLVPVDLSDQATMHYIFVQ